MEMYLGFGFIRLEFYEFTQMTLLKTAYGFQGFKIVKT